MDLTKAAVLLIDMQNESLFGIQNMDQSVANAAEVATDCRSLGIPVIYTRHVHRTNGVDAPIDVPKDDAGCPLTYRQGTHAVDIIDAVRPRETDLVIDKHRWSAFFGTNLDGLLRRLGVSTIIVGGFVTDGCVMTTVFDAFFRDYRVVLVKDMAAATGVTAHAGAVVTMAQWVYGLTVITAKEMLKALRQQEYQAWHSPGPDSVAVTPDTLVEVYERL